MLLTEQEEAPLKTLIRQEALMTGKFASYKVGANITGWVLKHQQPLKIDNLSEDTRFNTTEEERRQIQSALCIPIQFRTEMLGILTVTNKKLSPVQRQRFAPAFHYCRTVRTAHPQFAVAGRNHRQKAHGAGTGNGAKYSARPAADRIDRC